VRTTHLYLLLQSLKTTGELADCKAYLQIPSLKVGAYLLSLYDVYADTLDDDLISNEQIWLQAYGEKKPFKNTNFNAYSSQLCAFIKQFMVFSAMQNNNLLQYRYQLEVLRERNLLKLIEIKPTDYSPILQAQEYAVLFEIEDQTERYFEVSRKRNTDTEQRIFTAAQSLDEHYILHKLRYACNAMSHNAILRTEIALAATNLVAHLLTELVTAKPDFYKKHPLIFAYHSLYQIQTARHNYAQVMSFWKGFQQQEKGIGASDLDNIYSLLLNYCLQQRAQAEHTEQALFDQLTFEVYRYCFEHQCLAQIENNLSAHYKNIIKLRLEFQTNPSDIHAIEAFADANASKVLPEISVYIKALIAFHKTDYADAAAYLNACKFQDDFNNLDAYCLLLRIAYSDYQSNFVLWADNFRKALARYKPIDDYKPINEACYTGHKTFLSLMKKLYALRQKNKDGGKMQILEKMCAYEAQTKIYNKNWLLAQINLLP
jgi:hypothetical protein